MKLDYKIYIIGKKKMVIYKGEACSEKENNINNCSSFYSNNTSSENVTAICKG